MARKGENIFKRKDGRWEARYIHHYENGIAKYRYLYAPTYAEVKANAYMNYSRYHKQSPFRSSNPPNFPSLRKNGSLIFKAP